MAPYNNSKQNGLSVKVQHDNGSADITVADRTLHKKPIGYGRGYKTRTRCDAPKVGNAAAFKAQATGLTAQVVHRAAVKKFIGNIAALPKRQVGRKVSRNTRSDCTAKRDKAEGIIHIMRGFPSLNCRILA